VCIAGLSLALTLPSQVLRRAESPPPGGADGQDYDPSLAVMAMLAAHVALVRNPRHPTGILAGALLGLLVLVRHQFFLLWIIGMCSAAFCVGGSRAPRKLCLAYAGAALLTLTPWCLRNCLVLDAPMPLGTQGGHVLAAKFVEDKIGNGAWDPAQAARLWAKLTGKPSGYSYSALARDFRTIERSTPPPGLVPILVAEVGALLLVARSVRPSAELELEPGTRHQTDRSQ
jgi:hypothetical protein